MCGKEIFAILVSQVQYVAKSCIDNFQRAPYDRTMFIHATMKKCQGQNVKTFCFNIWAFMFMLLVHPLFMIEFTKECYIAQLSPLW